MTKSSRKVDVLVIGAGAAGLFCAAETARRGKSVLVVEHTHKPAEKVRISGGGRCNFTNLHTGPDNFVSENPHFAKSALARYTPQDFLKRLAEHGITWHEKTLGQLFCDGRSQKIISMLLDDLQEAGAELELGVTVGAITASDQGFTIATNTGHILSNKIVVASGGLSIPKVGATGFAYELAKQFGHRIVEPRPALVPLTFEGTQKAELARLAGVAALTIAKTNRTQFQEAMLFTHRGLSGPAILQISSYWRDGESISLDLTVGADVMASFKDLKRNHPKQSLMAALGDFLPKRLASYFLCEGSLHEFDGTRRLADTPDRELEVIAARLADWRLKPSGTEGWRTAEVTAGGIDTRELSSKTMESRKTPGLYFIGECIDVTGWLGGYNFQWAWASAWAAAQAL